MGRLFGIHNYKLDDKGRIPIPSKLREQLFGKIYIMDGLDGCLNIYTEQDFDKKIAQLESFGDTDEEARDAQRFSMMDVVELEMDKANRIKIPNDVIARFNITKDVVVVGAINRLEIWSQNVWDDLVAARKSKLSNTIKNLSNRS